MKYNYAFRNKVLFRYGQKAESFYIGLHGKLAVLKPEEEKYELTEEEYMLYLIKLKRNDELDILYKCIETNRKVYPLTETFDSWFEYDVYSVGSVVDRFPQRVVNEIKEFKQIFEMRQRYLETDDLYETIDDYIAKNIPDRIPGKQEKKTVIIFVYHHIHNLVTGSKFGDVAFQKQGQKRMATIITIDDCHLAVYNKKFYDDWLCKIDDNNIKMQVNFFATFPVFKNMNKNYFQNNYFYLFSRIQMTRGDKIITEGLEPDYIYFLKEGEYELSFRKSILDMTDMIEQYTGVKKDQLEDYYLTGIIYNNE
jgi:CRP-like cAMP-binding protein